MKRLTEKLDKNIYSGNPLQSHLIVNKLGQLEDYEEEFGIDLVTFAKAFKIIKEKEVNTRFLKQMFQNKGWLKYETYQDYLRKDCKEFKNAFLTVSLFPLTKEDFELLKEVVMRSTKKELEE